MFFKKFYYKSLGFNEKRDGIFEAENIANVLVIK